MPKATAPNAPWVAVWLSPQATVIPGCIMPCSGITMCITPWQPVFTSKNLMLLSAQFLRICSSISYANLSAYGSLVSVVGMIWSTVAKERFG